MVICVALRFVVKDNVATRANLIVVMASVVLRVVGLQALPNAVV